MKIRNRYVLVALLGAAQLVCFGWGVTLYSAWLTDSIRETVHRQVLADNVQTAKQMTALIREMRIGDVRTDEAAWERMQAVVREVRLPNEGYVCLVDSGDGALLCHPKLVAKPTLPQRGYATVQADSEERLTGGVVGEGETLEIVAAATIPSMHAKLLVHQRGQGIDHAVGEVVAPILPLGILVAVGIASATTCALLLTLRFYDNRLAGLNAELEARVEQRTRSLKKTRDAVIFGLAKLAESRDSDTGEHLERIATYVTLLGEQLQSDGVAIEPQVVRDLGLASSLHDIGKVGVADRVLLKPGRLDPEERKEIERHPLVGGDCLAAIGQRLGEDDFLQLAKEIAYGHHEKWDGSGYPAGVRGELIPLAARIVALADVYDALRSRRPYKEPMSHERARSIIIEGRGNHFDPIVVEAFLACEDRFIEVSRHSLDASQREHAETESPEPALA